MTSSEPFIEVRNVSRRFGGVQALADVSLTLLPGEVHALCGANGAGKSTLKNVIAGSVAPDAGELLVDGEHVTLRRPLDALDLGIHAVHQELGLIPWMSVEDNMYLGRYPHHPGGAVKRGELRERTVAALRRLGLTMSPKTPVGALSVGQQQLVEIARALSADPRCLLLDEPSAVLVGPELERVFEAVESLRSEGVAMIYVSHRLDEVFRLSDRVTVMRSGRVVESAITADFDQDTLIRAMTGKAVTATLSPPAAPRPDRRIEVRDLSAGNGRLKDLSFHASEGEILGIAGLMGSGRSHLLKSIYGIDERSDSSVYVDGRSLKPNSPSRAIRAGVTLVPEDRKSTGLILDLPIQRNLVLPSIGSISRAGTVSRRAERSLARRLIGLVGVPAERLPAPVSELSGGNQQKIALARWLDKDPRVLLVDEPTRGVDVGAKEEIYALLKALAARGTTVVVVSSEFEELLTICHRIIVMRDGDLVGEADPPSSSAEDLLRMCSLDPQEAVGG